MKKNAIMTIMSLAFIQVTAQKLPNVQQVSVWAPQSIKIDGKPTEWNDKYQAYNNATDINYTLSNDDKNLYLALKATNRLVIDGRILSGGISFTVNHTLNKKDANAVTVTYPVGQGKDWNLMRFLYDEVAGMEVGGNPNGDHSLTRLNKTFTEKSKFIGIAGIKGVAKNEIPVYNDLDIKVASAFHDPAVYVYELAIPLKLLALPENGTKAFSYHIKLNPSQEFADQIRKRASTSIASNLEAPPAPAPHYITPTDFWGEYTLAK